jgi:hypothetical protein
MSAILAETLKDVSTGYGSLIKTGIIILVAIAAFMWWMWRQA